ncbi:helix-turn-helix domain-containing protein [Actinomadura adrarensis]|uniref:Helix-turn-helix domain-containing protein n=1 Tax=Actinomadura adrarensis TaxID=1819600 RepID=A0ABW3CAT1_9ACTN
MSRTRHSPTLRRRRLSTELRKLRESSGLTQTTVTKRLEWSQGKLARMERGEWLRPDPHDIRLLLDLYEVADERQREQLITWAREGRQRGWWHPYKDMLSEAYSTYIGLESEAAAVLTFQALMIPGLLQTHDYARSIHSEWRTEATAEEIERRVEVRMARQEVLTQSDALRLWVVLDEAALHRQGGGTAVMREQMKRLLEAAELPKVTIQVIPYSAGPHPGATGPFSILKFPDLADPEAVYVENLAGELFIENPDEVQPFQIAFQRLVAVALSPQDTIAMIARLIRTS